jgi:glycosyltransferase involved in cell wall biosynthesis
MRILAISHACVVDVNQRIYRGLEGLGDAVTLVVPRTWRHEYSPGPFGPRLLEGFRGPLIDLPVSRPGSVPLHFYRARLDRVLREAQPEVVYVEEEPYSLAAYQWTRAAARAGVPCAFYAVQNISRRYPLPFRKAEAAVWRRSALALAASSDAAATLRARGYRGPVQELPFAVDMEAFGAAARSAELAQRLGLRRHVVGYLGRLIPEKGVRVLLQAYRGLPGLDDVSLLFVGSGPLAAECAAVPGVVVVEGLDHAAVPAYLRLVDLLAMPSLTTPRWKEQFGRAAIEAMACGIPVIGSDSGYIPELVEATGGGMVVPEGDATALAAALRDMLDDGVERAKLGQAGAASVRSRFSMEVVAAGLHDALHSISLR